MYSVVDTRRENRINPRTYGYVLLPSRNTSIAPRYILSNAKTNIHPAMLITVRSSICRLLLADDDYQYQVGGPCCWLIPNNRLPISAAAIT